MEISDRVRYVGPVTRWSGLEGKITGIWQGGRMDVDFDNGAYGTNINPSDLEKIMAGNQLAPRNTRAAVVAAHNRGNARCSIMLVSGTVFDFMIESVIEDGMIGRRSIAPEDTAAVVFFDAVAVVEFKA